MTHVTALIPYFQRESGLLREAVLSIFDQSLLHGGAPGNYGSGAANGWEASSGTRPGAPELGPCEVEVLIIDDGSPISPASELEDLTPPPGCTVRVVERENGGIAHCRNTGLDSVLPSSDYLAMLDSDDVWSPWHLERAVRALRGGVDVYTANWITAETRKPAFESMDKIRPEDHSPHGLMTDAYDFVGDPLLQEARSSIWRPSCLVFSLKKLGDLRNDPKQSHSSEDQLWRFEMLARQPLTAFSTRPEVRSGVGVSMFSGLRWTTDRGLLALNDRGRCMRKAKRLPGFTPAAKKMANQALSQARRDQVASVLHMTARGQRPRLKTLLKMGLGDPMLALVWPVYVAQAFVARRASKAHINEGSGGPNEPTPKSTSEPSRWGE